MFAQTSLAPLRGLMTSRQGMSDAMLREVVALLAYENPRVSSSCYFASHQLACRCSMLSNLCEGKRRVPHGDVVLPAQGPSVIKLDSMPAEGLLAGLSELPAASCPC